jgi:predicted N-acyltransferase
LPIRTVSSFREIKPEGWSRLAGASRDGAHAYNPFISHAFLSSLEDSRSAVRETGWLGQHLLLDNPDGTLRGAVPGYLKSHSQGEYVFDHAWANAFERAGGRYYPKLQCTVPFTPATGPRLLVCTGEDRVATLPMLAEAVKAETNALGISTAHVTFVPDGEWQALETRGFLHRTDQQFHFLNRGYATHDEFLERWRRASARR